MSRPDKMFDRLRGWTVRASPDHYGTFHIPRVAKLTDGSDECQEIDRRVARLLQAAPKLYLACRETMDWIDQARHGTLTDMESAMGRKIPQSQMREALEKVLGKDEYAVCQNCESSFFRSDLDPIEDLRQRVKPGQPLPAGQCPTCGTLCYFDDENEPDTA